MARVGGLAARRLGLTPARPLDAGEAHARTADLDDLLHRVQRLQRPENFYRLPGDAQRRVNETALRLRRARNQTAQMHSECHAAEGRGVDRILRGTVNLVYRVPGLNWPLRAVNWTAGGIGGALTSARPLMRGIRGDYENNIAYYSPLGWLQRKTIGWAADGLGDFALGISRRFEPPDSRGRTETDLASVNEISGIMRRGLRAHDGYQYQTLLRGMEAELQRQLLEPAANLSADDFRDSLIVLHRNGVSADVRQQILERLRNNAGGADAQKRALVMLDELDGQTQKSVTSLFRDNIDVESRQLAENTFRNPTDANIEAFWQNINEQRVFRNPEELAAFLNNPADGLAQNAIAIAEAHLANNRNADAARLAALANDIERIANQENNIFNLIQPYIRPNPFPNAGRSFADRLNFAEIDSLRVRLRNAINQAESIPGVRLTPEEQLDALNRLQERLRNPREQAIDDRVNAALDNAPTSLGWENIIPNRQLRRLWEQANLGRRFADNSIDARTVGEKTAALIADPNSQIVGLAYFRGRQGAAEKRFRRDALAAQRAAITTRADAERRADALINNPGTAGLLSRQRALARDAGDTTLTEGQRYMARQSLIENIDAPRARIAQRFQEIENNRMRAQREFRSAVIQGMKIGEPNWRNINRLINIIYDVQDPIRRQLPEFAGPRISWWQFWNWGRGVNPASIDAEPTANIWGNQAPGIAGYDGVEQYRYTRGAGYDIASLNRHGLGNQSVSWREWLRGQWELFRGRA